MQAQAKAQAKEAPEADERAEDVPKLASVTELAPAVAEKETAGPNIISETVTEIRTLMSEMQELREELTAHGVQSQTINVIVEMGFHGREGEQRALIDTALAASREAFGSEAIKREELEAHLDQLITLEKDMAHSRRVAKQRGLNLQALNFLTQIMRQNPGDGGELVINTFLGYAQACEVPLDRIEEITQRLTTEPDSVLPYIIRHDENAADLARKGLIRDVIVGSILAIGILWLMV